MKITGTRGSIDVELNGKVARFDGELGMHGFYAIADSMRWLPPYDKFQVNLAEKEEVIRAVIEESKGRDFRIFFQ